MMVALNNLSALFLSVVCDFVQKIYGLTPVIVLWLQLLNILLRSSFNCVHVVRIKDCSIVYVFGSECKGWTASITCLVYAKWSMSFADCFHVSNLRK